MTYRWVVTLKGGRTVEVAAHDVVSDDGVLVARDDRARVLASFARGHWVTVQPRRRGNDVD